MVAFGRASLALLVVGVVLFPALAAAQYTAIDLGSLPGAANSEPLAVNDRGDAAGISGFDFPTSGDATAVRSNSRVMPSCAGRSGEGGQAALEGVLARDAN
jgi:hypothetical protein